MARRTAPQRSHIARKPQASFLARRSPRQFIAALRSRKLDEWPVHLFGACQILTADLAVSETMARRIVFKSVCVAQDCVRGESKRIDHIEADLARLKIGQTCSRVSKCIGRAPAALRRHLDEDIAALIENFESDIETIEAIIPRTKAAFEDNKLLNSEASRTALETLNGPCAAEYAALDFDVRKKVIEALGKFRNSGRQVKAADLFATLGGILDNIKAPKVRSQTRDLRTRYVAQLREIWTMEGLKPKRLLDYVDFRPISPFHHFVELVYVGVAAPWILLHKDHRPLVDAKPRLALRRADYRWAISDDHVRNGLKLSFKFTPAELQNIESIIG